MMTIVWAAFCFIVIFSYQIFRRHTKRCKSLPPGPPSLPVVGSIPFIHRNHGLADALVHKSLYKYDPNLCTVWIGNVPIIIIQDFSLAKELFSRDEFCGRPTGYKSQYITGSNGEHLGIVRTMGRFWQDQRRFTLKHLKNLGFGRQQLDTIIQEEVKDFMEALLIRSHNGDVLIDNIFNFPIINILWQIIASKKYDPNLSDTQMMMNKISKFFQHGPSILNTIEFLRARVPPLEEDKLTFAMKAMFRKQIEVHENNFDCISEPRDFIDIYLREIQQNRNSKDRTSGGELSNFNTEQLVTICLDFFQAGSETSSTTLSWAVMYLMLYPAVQEKCKAEIDLILGDKLPSKEDASKLIYCVATIQEIQRLSCVAPVTLLHANTRDIELKGYKLSKGTRIVANLTKFMKDPEVFAEPFKFMPERFIEYEIDNDSSHRKLKVFQMLYRSNISSLH